MNSLGRRSPTMQGSVSSGRSYLSRLLPRPAWLLALTLGLASPASAQAPGTWAPTADLNQPRAEHTIEEHTSELQSRLHLVCRLLLEKKNKKTSERFCPRPEETD